MRRFFLPASLILCLSVLTIGCVRNVSIAEALPLQKELSREELVQRINAYAEVQTFSAQTDIYVRNYFTGKNNKAHLYPEAGAALRLKRPESILMRVSFYGPKIADMVTDGHRFFIAIYKPEDKRQFIYGTNLKSIEHMDNEELKGAQDPRLQEAGGLVNMRPQHVVDAFLIKPAHPDGKTEIFREEFAQEEIDAEPGQKKRKVLRTYYVIYVLERKDSGALELRRKYWFDRTKPNTPLARQQVFENGGGKAVSNITYSNWLSVAGSNLMWPELVFIDRRDDGYSLQIDLVKDSIEINGEMPDTIFKLENTEKLKEINLDEPRKVVPGTPATSKQKRR